MTFLFRPWLAPSPPVVFDPLNIGIAFLVNIGYGGPVAPDDGPAIRGITCPSLHRWPPVGMTKTTPRRQLLRQVLQSAGGVDEAAAEGLARDLLALAARADDSEFKDNYADQPDAPLVSDGVCLAPALLAGDAVAELPGETIHAGDFVAVVLRGTLTPLIKTFAGVIDREGFPAGLFYLKQPERVIEVPLADVLFARKVVAPRQYDGRALLAEADSFVAKWRERFYLSDTMEPVGTTRTAAWVRSMGSIFEVLRGQPG